MKRLAFISLLTAIMLDDISPVQATGIPDGKSTKEDFFRLLQEGSELTAKTAEELQAKLQQDPKDIESRLRLIGYQKARDKMPPAGVELLLGLIENHPAESGTGPVCIILSNLYDHDAMQSAVLLWERLIKAKAADARVLGNGAMWLSHFSMVEPVQLARSKSLFEKARLLEPKNATWAEHLGGVLLAEAQTLEPPQRTAVAKQAVGQFTAAWQLLDQDRRASFRPLDINYHAVLADAFLLAEDGESAKSHAVALLKTIDQKEESWNYGNLIHEMNVLLGKIALEEGKGDIAATYLVAAGKTPGSPQLDSFGPPLSLAHALLEKGQRDAVVQYLDLCAKFWKMDRGRIATWKQEIRKGGMPDFGGLERR